ncbi:MAG: hypothetical protein U0802_16875 [Candidatus Binatia bacterium]
MRVLGRGGWAANGVSVVQTAQAMRASLLASAMAAGCAAAARQGERPLREAVRARRGALGVAEDGAGAVGEEHAQVGVAALADGAEARRAPLECSRG